MRYFIGFFLSIFLFSCQSVDTKLIEGFWLADKVLEEGQELELDLSDIGFEFKNKNHYIYYNTEFLSEDGIYEIRGNTLFTTDTSSEGQLRKAVQIITLTVDSLHLRMNAHGKEQILYLYKMNTESEEGDFDIDETEEGIDVEEPDSSFQDQE